MEQRLWMILQLFGGAALFLYSMDTLTDALQQAAGDTLRQALARLTAHPLAGVLTGAAVTAVVQSSSAVTVLVLGLVGAGLLTLQRAVPVVFGANIGTTVTAQLLAFRLEDARYLLLVAGLLLWFAGRGRLHAAGQALFAFGLLFEGIAVMAEAMEPLAAGPVFRQWMAQVRHRPGLGLLAGLGMTLAVQSSSATIAVLQQVAARPGPDGGCLLGLAGAIPVLLGTTSAPPSRRCWHRWGRAGTPSVWRRPTPCLTCPGRRCAGCCCPSSPRWCGWSRPTGRRAPCWPGRSPTPTPCSIWAARCCGCP